ncbi:MAG TPA: hypothetical protein ENH82_20260 [bacterium]|nr:hypothetical protein [bacterium]
MTRIKRISFFVMIFLLISVGMVYAESVGKETLQGLKGVNVWVGTIGSDVEKDGFSINPIQTDIELKLRMVGIKVLTKEELIKEPGMPILFVSIGGIKNIVGVWAFFINVKLLQQVYLLRDINLLYPAPTWTSGGFMGFRFGSEKNSIRDIVKDQVDEFINDYLAVNPKE